MKYKNILLFLIILLIPMLTISYGQDADGFRYPIGNGDVSEQINTKGSEAINTEYHEYKEIPEDGNNDRRCSAKCTNWYNANDVGNFVVIKNDKGKIVAGGGLHPGEDWNYQGGDTGEPVYSIANGVVEYIHNYGGIGHCIVIKHTIPKDSTVSPYEGGTFSTQPKVIYSKYLHVTPVNLEEKQEIEKGHQIATIKGIKLFSPHLHFEIRTEVLDENKKAVDPCTYPKGNSNGYYSFNGEVVNTMSSGNNTKTAMGRMKTDGILDPSDFIQANKDFISNNKDECTFSDVNDSSKKIIESLCNKKIVSGYSNGTVLPNALINRAEFAKIISIAKNNNNDDFIPCPENEEIFSDVKYQELDNEANWYCKYVKYAKKENIINGYNKNNTPCTTQEGSSLNAFCPNNNINYHEVAKMVITALGGVEHDDDYWTNSNKRNQNDGTAKEKSYIGCADKLNLFSFDGNDYKSIKFECVSDESGYCVYDKITRERAFAAIYNAAELEKEAFENCFQ